MWQSQVPFLHKRLHQPLKINNNKFVMASTKLHTASRGKFYGIYKFDCNKNRWWQILQYEKDFVCNIRSAAYDNSKKLLYINILKNSFDIKNSSYIVIFDLEKKKKITEIQCKSTRFSQLIFMNNKLNQIINYPKQSPQNGNHHVYNNQNNTLCLL
eukprot:481118_1